MCRLSFFIDVLGVKNIVLMKNNKTVQEFSPDLHALCVCLHCISKYLCFEKVNVFKDLLEPLQIIGAESWCRSNSCKVIYITHLSLFLTYSHAQNTGLDEGSAESFTSLGSGVKEIGASLPSVCSQTPESSPVRDTVLQSHLIGTVLLFSFYMHLFCWSSNTGRTNHPHLQSYNRGMFVFMWVDRHGQNFHAFFKILSI